MNSDEKKLDKKRVIKWSVIYLAALLLLVFVINVEQVNAWIGGVLSLFRPLLIGLAIAYLANPIFRFLERKVFFRLRPQAFRRALSLTLTYIFLILLVACVILLIIPQLLDSIITFLGNYNAHITSAIQQINRTFASINGFFEGLTGNDTLLEYLDEAAIRESAADFLANIDKISQDLLGKISGEDLKPIQDFFGSALSLLADSIFGLFVSIYLLASKEKRYAQVMKLRRALFNNLTNERITRLCSIADRTFGGFLEGKILDSILIGILIYIVISIFGIPYAILIAAIMAVFNIIPIIGPFVGAIPTALIILLTDPGKVIPYLIIVIIIQQIDNNVISPKILGSNTGVSSLCILISISVMGRLWGFLGMFLGVPIFATVLEVADEFTVATLQKKGHPSGVANYYDPDAMVDPAKNAHNMTDKTVQRFEKRALHLRNRQESGEKMNRKERFILAIYRMAHKYHILSELTDQTHARYSAEQATKEAELEAEEQLEAIRAQRKREQEEAELKTAVEAEESTDAQTAEATEGDTTPTGAQAEDEAATQAPPTA